MQWDQLLEIHLTLERSSPGIYIVSFRVSWYGTTYTLLYPQSLYKILQRLWIRIIDSLLAGNMLPLRFFKWISHLVDISIQSTFCVSSVHLYAMFVHVKWNLYDFRNEHLSYIFVYNAVQPIFTFFFDRVICIISITIMWS